MFPTEGDPVYGSFVARQMESVRAAGAEVEILFVDARGADWQYPAALLRVAAAVRKGHFDVVHAHYGLTGFFASFHHVPLVVSFCGDDLMGTPDGSGGTRFMSRLARRLSWIAARRADAIICKSEALRLALPSERDRLRAHVISNGVDVELFHPGDRNTARERLGIERHERLILFPHSRSQSAVKRFDLAEAAVAELNRLGVTARLWVINGVVPNDMPPYYQAADCMLLTSEHEGSPNTVKEALCCDLPVVSTDVGDVRQWAERAGGCMIVRANPAGIALALRTVLQGRSRADGSQVRQLLSMESVAGSVLGVYSEACARPRPSGEGNGE
jgi:glycosyltransferase involved in cell wall biosynthesis